MKCFSFRMDETCSHVVAVLFKAHMAVLLGLNKTSATSTACQWNRQFRKNVSAAKVQDITFTQKGKSKRKCVSHILSQSQLRSIEKEAKAFGKENECAFMLCVDEAGSSCGFLERETIPQP